MNNNVALPVHLPSNTEELTAIVTNAHQDRQPLLVCGSGSKLTWGGLVTDATAIVSTEKLDRVIAHAVGDLTVTVEAGLTLDRLQSTLAEAGQFLPLDPVYPDRATLGGIIATADTGSWRHRYGGVRDLLLGISFVRADGKIAKAGGRVVKNVAGYDLMKLFTGSYGTLGILTEVTFRVYPLPGASATVILTGDTAALTTTVRQLLASALTPMAVDVLSTALSQQLEISNTPSLVVKFATLPASIEQQSSQLLEMGKALGLKGGTWQGEPEQQLWRGIQTGIWGQTPIGVDAPAAIACKLGVKPMAAVDTLAMLDRLTDNSNLGAIHVGSGVGATTLTAPEQIAPLRIHCEAAGGFLSVLQAPTAVKQSIDVWGYRSNARVLMEQLKQQFDPQGILNPGRYF
jgi:glycolate oxidase FAD binding subunit